MDELLDRPATTLAAQIRRREISPREVVAAHIAHIEAVNPQLNALIADRFELALREADAAEARVLAAKDGDTLPPLLGLPFTSKAFMMAEGMPLCGGVWHRRDIRAQRDAECIRRLREAGAILLGTSNVPEGGIWMETYNAIYGRTLNPWNPHRTSGGSSGGEGALVATGGVVFGLGSDIGGSIRIPAGFCGTVGHKPTGRLVPNTGFWPPCEGQKLSAYLVHGPLSRTVADARLILESLIGPDGVDTTCAAQEVDLAPTHIEDVTVYVAIDHGNLRTHPDYRRAVEAAATALEQAGAQIREFPKHLLKDSFTRWGTMLRTGGGPTYGATIGDGEPLRPGRELLRMFTGRSHHTLPAIATVALEQYFPTTRWLDERVIRSTVRQQAEIEALLGPRGVILHPPYRTPAPPHHRAFARPFDFVYTGLFNVLEYPATVVPLGMFNDAGLPLSVQVIGRRGADGLTLGVAAVLEQAFGGWKRACPTVDTATAQRLAKAPMQRVLAEPFLNRSEQRAHPVRA